MNTVRCGPELSAAKTRGLGVFLLLLALVVPLGVLWHWLSTQSPPPSNTASVAQLRPELVIVPAGALLMGSPEEEAGRYKRETRHRVNITRAFAIGRTEVTRSQFQGVMGTLSPAVRECLETVESTPDSPMVCVSWEEAMAYAHRLSELELGLVLKGSTAGTDFGPPMNAYRLPTEAEWAYAAQAGRRTIYVGTNVYQSVCDYGHVGAAFACVSDNTSLVDVASTRENGWGLWGFGGNAAEWVWDRYEPFDAADQIDPVGSSTGKERVIRGASWTTTMRGARLAFRHRAESSARNTATGFRIARSCAAGSDELTTCFTSRSAQ